MLLPMPLQIDFRLFSLQTDVTHCDIVFFLLASFSVL